MFICKFTKLKHQYCGCTAWLLCERLSETINLHSN